MAGDWIKMRGNLWDDPRIANICDLTDQSEAMVIGGLYWLWATADQHTEDGILPGLTCRSIDRKTGIQGFAEALISVGWLADHPEGVRIVNFEEHNGASAKKRCQTARRVSNFKANNAEVTQPALPEEQESVSDALPREEKRREEIDIDAKASKSGTAFPTCPHQEILALYRQHLPHLTQPRVWEGNRAAMLKERWRQAAKPSAYSPTGYTTHEEGLSWWNSFFQYIANDTTLPNGFQSQGRSWKPDLEWMVNANNFAKIIDGKYDK